MAWSLLIVCVFAESLWPISLGSLLWAPWGLAGALCSNGTFTFHFHALEKEMATHSIILAWRIPGTEESSGLPSMGSHRVGYD